MKYKMVVLFLVCAVTLFAQPVSENDEIAEYEMQHIETSKEKIIGLTLSLSGFSSFRLGGGLYFASLTDDGHHSFGWDTGLLYEYNFNDKINYNRVYFHFTGGVGLALLGGSMVLAYDKDDMSVGFAPEAGVGISSVFGFFFRYNFYLDKKFNSYEIVLHINFCSVSFSKKTFRPIF